MGTDSCPSVLGTGSEALQQQEVPSGASRLQGFKQPSPSALCSGQPLARQSLPRALQAERLAPEAGAKPRRAIAALRWLGNSQHPGEDWRDPQSTACRGQHGAERQETWARTPMQLEPGFLPLTTRPWGGSCSTQQSFAWLQFQALAASPGRPMLPCTCPGTAQAGSVPLPKPSRLPRRAREPASCAHVVSPFPSQAVPGPSPAPPVLLASVARRGAELPQHLGGILPGPPRSLLP